MSPKKGKNKSLVLWLPFIIVALIIGYFLGKGYKITAPESESKVKVPQLVLTAKALDIIKELNCACGSCVEALINCSCKISKGADEMKRFIQTKIDEGLTKSQIFEKIVEKYGKAVFINKKLK
jgi:cytochrome c-type biogenesis protein CcmH/NrfF